MCLDFGGVFFGPMGLGGDVGGFSTLYIINYSSASASFDNISFNSAAYKSMLRSSNSLHGPSNRSKA